MEVTVDRRYLSDPRRVNEFRKYYQSKNIVHRQPVIADLHAPGVDQDGPGDFAAAVAAAATGRDFTLGAYATCLVHSIDVDKVMVSLLDDTTQYFLGGATKLTSSVVEGDRDPELWFGCSSIGIAGGICEIACSVTPDARHYPFYIVPDIADEPQWRDAVGAYRFYVGIPIKTRAGYNIGTLFAFSVRPRLELEPSEKLIMERMAQQVMNHLELELKVLERSRLLLMNQSLAHFAASRDSTALDEPRTPSTKLVERRDTAKCGGGSGSGRSVRQTDSSLPDCSTDNAGFTSQVQREPTQQRKEPCMLKAEPGAEKSTEGPGTSPPSSEAGNRSPKMPVHSTPLGLAKHPAGRSSSHSSTYTRAASMLRDGLGCTGVVLLSVDRDDFHTDSDSHVTFLGSSINTTDADQQPHCSAHVLRELLRLYPQEGHIFYFDSEGWSWPTTEDDISTSVSYQPHLIKYPDLSTEPGAGGERESHGTNLARTLQNSSLVPRQVLIAPLKSTREERLGIAVAWSDNWDRVMTRSVELRFALCFCANIFAEILHQEAIVADRQKADFIANVSHELRSPLHGILASAELLKDTGTTELQHSLMEDVQSCGRVLLNTIDHVLDFSNLLRSEQRTPRGLRERNDSVVASTEQIRAPSRQTYGPRENPLLLNQPTKLDLALLCEDVVDSVFISRLFHGSVSSTVSRAISPGLPDMGVALPPVVSLSIVPSDWNFVIQPGAIQRIIMNLLGNAIKYTTRGFIRVSLTANRPQSSQGDLDSDGDSTVVLVVSDSGRGISPDYIRTRLWCAFAQEDQTVHGTGLGLSITKRIVNMLGGTIDLQSTTNVGTTVTVTLPLRRHSADDRSADANSESHASHLRQTHDTEAQISEMRNLGQGRTAVILLRNVESGTSYLEQYKPEARHANEALVGYLTEWFAFKVTSQLNGDSAIDLIFVDEERLSDVQLPPHIPRVILKDSSYVTPDSREPVGVPLAYVRRPVAPRKLERALKEALGQESYNIDNRGHKIALTGKNQAIADPVTSSATEILSTGPTLNHSAPAPDTTPRSANKTAQLDRLSTESNVAPKANDTTCTKRASPSAPAKPPAHDWQTSIPRVLVVDDNAINLKVLSAYLSKNQIPETHLSAAVNGSEAVQQFTKAHMSGQRFDIVLMDLNMPVKDGFEAITEIRDYEIARETPPTMVVALTGLVSERDQERAFVAGADQFFSKPFSGKQVKTLLESWGRDWRHQQQRM